MDLEYHPKCVYDAVKIYNLRAISSNGDVSTPEAADNGLGAPLPLSPDHTFCGSEVPKPVILDADAVIEFQSDHIVPKPGFSATAVFTMPLGRLTCFRPRLVSLL